MAIKGRLRGGRVLFLCFTEPFFTTSTGRLLFLEGIFYFILLPPSRFVDLDWFLLLLLLFGYNVETNTVKAMADNNKASLNASEGSLSAEEKREHPVLDPVLDPQPNNNTLDYPEGGFRAWLVVSGAAAVMFCTFGYLTGFG